MAAFVSRSSIALSAIAICAGLVSGCASAPTPMSSPNQTGVTMAQFMDSSRWVCTRQTFAGETITIQPPRDQVTESTDATTADWYCSGGGYSPGAGFAVREFHANVTGYPVADTDRPGDGLIGASLRQETGQFVVDYLTPGGAAAQSGELQVGDRILAVAETAGDDLRSAAGLELRQLVWLIRGQAGSQVQLQVQAPGDVHPRDVVLTRARPDSDQLLAIKQHHETAKQEQQAAALRNLVLPDNSGAYLSPYTSDGVTAEWVNKALNANLGATAGSAIGGVAGAYAANKALESIPFAGVFGGMLGAGAGKSIGRNTAIEASGGWDFIRATSDQSFRSLADMATYLRTTYGTEASFNEVMAAASQVYPELADALASN
ncbi:S41 family peptidase [Marinobacter goseongensis]|jgi:hypothetical protein|uniref:S41 family peptidase n=1 Tax=Marinobacter goseongensis TaxID=453838 RepID=UPI0020066E48|nr:PDZ domain-containing protein [Marinobacter goseongensis]MCK7550798.1 PDZ domain-containing protein [Marinobacter goseongensis]